MILHQLQYNPSNINSFFFTLRTGLPRKVSTVPYYSRYYDTYLETKRKSKAEHESRTTKHQLNNIIIVFIVCVPNMSLM